MSTDLETAARVAELEHALAAARAEAERERLAGETYRRACHEAERERDAARAEAEQAKQHAPRHPFDARCADALADEVAVLIRRGVIDSSSPAGDALLDYRDPPPTPHSDRLAELERDAADARAALGAIENWTHIHGVALCPTAGTADTFGNGMREAKRQVTQLLHARHRGTGS